MNLLSKENITFMIAVAGFLMSALTWLKEFWCKRNAIDISVIDYSRRNGVIQFYLLFQNKSALQTSISKIEIEFKGACYTCELEPKLIKETPSVCIKTPHFPVVLPAASFYSCYLEFLRIPDMRLAPGIVVLFQIHTNRGILRKSLTLSDTGHYLHKKS